LIECRVPHEDSPHGQLAQGQVHAFNVKVRSLQQANEVIEAIKNSLRVVGRLVEDREGLHV